MTSGVRSPTMRVNKSGRQPARAEGRSGVVATSPIVGRDAHDLRRLLTNRGLDAAAPALSEFRKGRSSALRTGVPSTNVILEVEVLPGAGHCD